ncbi:hypothetical protein HZS_4121 [Henneguya salminicola]|nr:hypothetical protein HZS_4121 [Henneguya salminicola]
MNPIEAAMSSPLSLQRNGQSFLKRYWVVDIPMEMHRIPILATNESSTLLRYNSHNFIDGTFKITPHTFFQCVIVMTNDCGTELYVSLMRLCIS